MAAAAESRFNAEVLNSHIFPLRLIEVCATLASEGGVCFATAVCDWDFHVISHTWSWSIRELSKKAGTVVRESSTDEAGGWRSYEESFARASFKGEASYDSLMHFLKILAADGVERVWFDALCINQMDTDEKDREICQMGAYYGLSQGCYVVCHGIGEGYHALDMTTGDVPRWFTRVWTIQECILPSKLTFIVQKFDRTTLEVLEEISAGVKSLVSSWVASSNSSGSSRHAEDMIAPSVASRGLSIGSYFQRRVEIPGGDSDQELYFVDSNDYTDLMMHQYWVWGHLQGKCAVEAYERVMPIFLIMDRRNHAAGSGRNDDFLGLQDWALQRDVELEAAGSSHVSACILRSLGGLEGFRQHNHERLINGTILRPLLSPENLATQIMDRHCSVEEDRVLSILALFGIKGELQLRTGQGLEAQLLSLARILNRENPRLLLNLCAVDSRSNAIPYMSWVPDICHRVERMTSSRKNLSLARVFFQTVSYLRFYAADVLGIDGVGRLKLQAKVCEGCLMGLASELDKYWMEVKGVRFPNATNGQLSTDTVELGFERMAARDGRPYLHLRDFYEALNDNQGIVWGHIYLAGKDLHKLAQNLEAPNPTMICNIWLLLLGYTNDPERDGEGPRLQCLLVCLRGAGDSTELHKIGTLYLLESAYIDFSSDKFAEWSLGGFGLDVRSCLSAWKA